MMMIAILLSFQGTPQQKATSSAAVAFFFTYMLSKPTSSHSHRIKTTNSNAVFGASVNCIPWCYVPEILPLHARAKGTAIGISSNWLCMLPSHFKSRA